MEPPTMHLRSRMTPEAILKCLGELGISARARGDKLRVEPGSRVPPELVSEIRQHKQGILELLGEAPSADNITAPLLAWAAEAAEAGMVLPGPIQFLETPLRPYTTSQVGRYCREKLRYLALAQSNRVTVGWGRFAPEWWREVEVEAIQALTALKAAIDEAGVLRCVDGPAGTGGPWDERQEG
jgi:hypothetical protein